MFKKFRKKRINETVSAEILKELENEEIVIELENVLDELNFNVYNYDGVIDYIEKYNKSYHINNNKYDMHYDTIVHKCRYGLHQMEERDIEYYKKEVVELAGKILEEKKRIEKEKFEQELKEMWKWEEELLEYEEGIKKLELIKKLENEEIVIELEKILRRQKELASEASCGLLKKADEPFGYDGVLSYIEEYNRYYECNYGAINYKIFVGFEKLDMVETERYIREVIILAKRILEEKKEEQ